MLQFGLLCLRAAFGEKDRIQRRQSERSQRALDRLIDLSILLIDVVPLATDLGRVREQCCHPGVEDRFDLSACRWGRRRPAGRYRSIGRREEGAESMGQPDAASRRTDHVQFRRRHFPCSDGIQCGARAQRIALHELIHTFGYNTVSHGVDQIVEGFERLHQCREVRAAGRRKSQGRVAERNGGDIPGRLRCLALLACGPSSMQGQSIDHGGSRQRFQRLIPLRGEPRGECRPCGDEVGHGPAALPTFLREDLAVEFCGECALVDLHLVRGGNGIRFCGVEQLGLGPFREQACAIPCADGLLCGGGLGQGGGMGLGELFDAVLPLIQIPRFQQLDGIPPYGGLNHLALGFGRLLLRQHLGRLRHLCLRGLRLFCECLDRM